MYRVADDNFLGGGAEEVGTLRFCQQARHRRRHDGHGGGKRSRPICHQEPQVPDLQDVGNQGRRARRGDGMVCFTLRC